LNVTLNNDQQKESFRAAFLASASSRGVDDPVYYDVVFDLASRLAAFGDTTSTVSVAGAQGSGKSTFAELLSLTINEVTSRSAAVLCLDDFYLTHAEREILADRVHPMLRVRGVPGTHDIGMIKEALQALQQGRAVSVPVFDKASDDRARAPRIIDPVDIVVTEGWCWGAIPEDATRLAEPINEMEAEHDPDGIWRQYVNQQLAGDYQSLFNADVHVFLRVPSMEAVYRWRLQQEQGLPHPDRRNAMDQAAITKFVGNFERITRWMLEEMPARADLVVELNESHRIIRSYSKVTRYP
jgi:D-glycerate 3-kinase